MQETTDDHVICVINMENRIEALEAEVARALLLGQLRTVGQVAAANKRATDARQSSERDKSLVMTLSAAMDKLSSLRAVGGHSS